MAYKMTAELVRALRKDRAAGMKLRELKAKYGISMAEASKIVNNLRWVE